MTYFEFVRYKYAFGEILDFQKRDYREIKNFKFDPYIKYKKYCNICEINQYNNTSAIVSLFIKPSKN